MSRAILKFEKPGCAPCKVVSELLDKHQIKYDTVNLVHQPEMFKEYNVMSTPTILVLNDKNEIISKIIGVVEHAIENLKE